MDEFERMFAEEMAVDGDDPGEEELDEKTPEYLIREGHTRYKLLSSMLLVYFHAQHGESMAELFHSGEEIRDSQIQFQLGDKGKK